MRARSALPQDVVRAISAAAGALTWAAAAWARTPTAAGRGRLRPVQETWEPRARGAGGGGCCCGVPGAAGCCAGAPGAGCCGVASGCCGVAGGCCGVADVGGCCCCGAPAFGAGSCPAGGPGGDTCPAGGAGAGAGACAPSGIDMTTVSDAAERNHRHVAFERADKLGKRGGVRHAFHEHVAPDCGEAGSCARAFEGRAATRAAATVHTATTRMTSPFRDSSRAQRCKRHSYQEAASAEAAATEGVKSRAGS